MSLLARLFKMFRPRVLDEECEEELRFHLDERAAKYVQEGMSEDAAQGAARARFGDTTAIKAAMLEVRMMNRSFLAGVLTGVLLAVVMGAIIVPATIAWLNQTPTVQFMPGGDDSATDRRPHYTSPVVTMRCADGRLQHTVLMSRREPTTAEVVPPPGCEVVVVRRP